MVFRLTSQKREGEKMKKFEITINASFIVEAEDEEEAKQEVLINYMLDKHDLEVDEVEDE